MTSNVHLSLSLAFLLWFCAPSIAQTTFTNIAPSAGIDHYCDLHWDMGGGVAIFDFNKDSLQDIYYTGGINRDALYLNNGDGTYTNISLSAGLGFTDSVKTMGVCTGDFNNDGYRDVFLNTPKGEPNRLLKNNGNGTFSDISVSAGLVQDSLFTMSSAWGDYNKDGYLDLYVTNYILHPNVILDSVNNFLGFDHQCSPNRLFLNNGDETFTDVTNTTQTGDTGCALATTITDYDSDGDMDIWVINDFGQWILPNELYQNTNGNLNPVAAAANVDARMFGMGIAIGDYDQDLDLDYYITNIGRNLLHKNEGNGTFIDTTAAAGVENEWYIQDSLHATGWGTGFMDIDNDSYLDLFVSNGYVPAVPELMTSLIDPDKLFKNNGDGTFTDISHTFNPDSAHVTRGFAYGDMDNDGDIDLIPVATLISNAVDTHKVVLFQNNLNNNNNWLAVALEGTTSNRDAFGSQIIIYVNGQSWIHEISGGSSHTSQNSSVAHFGLGTATIVDSLIINWTNGLQEKLTNITPNQTLYLTEGLITHLNPVFAASTQLNAMPIPAQQTLFIQYQMNTPQEASLSLSNALGQIVWTTSINQSKESLQIATDHLPNGFYLLQLNTTDEQAVKKIIIQH